MKKTDFYQTIFKRKSIRNYDLTPLYEDLLAEISKYMNTLKPLYENIKTEMKIVSPNDVKRRLMKKAPHYIVVFSENKEGFLTNVGYMMQQMDLFLSTNGIGSCWQGIPIPTKEVLKSSNLEYVILMAFGKPREPLYRINISEFKRKPLQQITDVTNADELLEAVRLAPSAGNSQLWFFTGDENVIHAYSVKPSFLRGLVTKKYISIDMGIAIYHLQVAAEHSDKETAIVFDEIAKMNPPQGCEYVASLKVE